MTRAPSAAASCSRRSGSAGTWPRWFTWSVRLVTVFSHGPFAERCARVVHEHVEPVVLVARSCFANVAHRTRSCARSSATHLDAVVAAARCLIYRQCFLAAVSVPRAVNTTRAPIAASAIAVSLPIPALPPVTSTTRPSIASVMGRI